MRYVITKTIILMTNGDRKVVNKEIPTNDLECIRLALHASHECKEVIFIYREEY